MKMVVVALTVLLTGAALIGLAGLAIHAVRALAHACRDFIAEVEEAQG